MEVICKAVFHLPSEFTLTACGGIVSNASCLASEWAHGRWRWWKCRPQEITQPTRSAPQSITILTKIEAVRCHEAAITAPDALRCSRPPPIPAGPTW